MLIAISSVPFVGVLQQPGGYNVVLGTQAESVPTDYVLAGPILVTSDDEFNTTVWSGSGTEGDPYLVENLNITTNTECAKVTNTTKHFEIRNCFFASAGAPYSDGIQLDNVTNGAVRNCIIRGKMTGIACDWFNNSIISDNTIFNCSTGMQAGLISNVTISGNTVYNINSGMLSFVAINSHIVHNTVFNCTFAGVRLFYALNNSRFAYNTVHSIGIIHGMGSCIEMWGPTGWIVEENVLYDSSYAMNMWWVEDCIVRNNDISRCSRGIEAWGVSGSVFEGNTFSGCQSAMLFHESNDCVLLNNTLSDIGYRGIEIRDSTEFNVTGNSLDRCGITIEGLTVLTWRHVVIDNTVNGKELGYFVDESDIVIDGTVYGAVYLVNCDGVTVQNGEFHNGSMGVCIAFSDHCRVVDCEVQGHLHGGIRLFYSEDCILERNIICSNSRYGWGYGGIDLGFVANCRITRNRIYWNQWSGINVRYEMTAVNCTIVNNAIYNNSYYGISIWGYDNTIYGNAIGWNEGGNAIDSGSDNTWDNGVDTGNWWSDYDGTGEYAIDGNAHSVDRYPNILPNGTPSFPMDPLGGFSVEFLILAGGGVIIAAIGLFIIFKRRRIP
jgi:parallel beta-helix repeat protein